MHSAEKLLYSLISIHHDLSSDKTIEQSFKNIEETLSEAGNHQVLNDLVNATMNLNDHQELIDQMAEDIQGDPMIGFYEDILNYISLEVGQELVDGVEQKFKAEIFALPTFGSHNTIRSLHERRGFSDLLQDSNIIPTEGRMILFGMLPLQEAISVVTNPQRLFNFSKQSFDLLRDTQNSSPNSSLQEIQEDMGVQLTPHTHGNAMVYGGYLVLGAYLSKIDAKDEETLSLLNLNGLDEKQMADFDQLKKAWVEGQPDATELEETDIFPPSSLLEATATTFANSTFNSVLIENSLGSPMDVEIARIEVAFPDKQLEEHDRAVVTFYDPQDQMINFIHVMAAPLYVMLPLVTQYWELACECDVEIVPLTEQKQVVKRTLH